MVYIIYLSCCFTLFHLVSHRFTLLTSPFLVSCEGFGRCYRCAIFEANKYIKNMGKDIETGFDVEALGKQATANRGNQSFKLCQCRNVDE